VLVSLVAGIAVLLGASRFGGPSAPQDSQEAAKQAKAKEDKEAKEKADALKRAALERELPISREKLAKVQRDLADHATDADATNAKLGKELQLAKMKLETFEKREMPTKIARGQLDVQNSKDSLDNAKEELEQLEIMYKDQDLADKTREIVIRRAKRDLDRAQKRLALQQEDFAILSERTLPQDREKLALDVEEKEREIARTDRATQKAMMDKKIAVMAAESDIKRIETELAGLKGDAK
jgi:hypothetical protein